MSYEFTKLSEVPAVSKFPEGANAIIETNGEIKRCPSSGGGSVPKPLTYDYMPEGYPSKTIQTTTVMTEQALAFSQKGDGPVYVGGLAGAFEIVVGQTYTVNWDGTEYECICSAANEKVYQIGNASIMGKGDDTGEPFLCAHNTVHGGFQFYTFDTSATHTISVKTTQEIVTPMAKEFIPTGANSTTVFYL